MRLSKTIQLALTFLFLYRVQLLLSSISKKIYPYEVLKEEVSSRRELCIRGIHHNCWHGSQVTKKAPQLSKYMNEIIISTHQKPEEHFYLQAVKNASGTIRNPSTSTFTNLDHLKTKYISQNTKRVNAYTPL